MLYCKYKSWFSYCLQRSEHSGNTSTAESCWPRQKSKGKSEVTQLSPFYYLSEKEHLTTLAMFANFWWVPVLPNPLCRKFREEGTEWKQKQFPTSSSELVFTSVIEKPHDFLDICCTHYIPYFILTSVAKRASHVSISNEPLAIQYEA